MDKDANLGYFNEKNSYILGLILLYKLKNENNYTRINKLHLP